jgi:exosome complex component RRP4
LTLYVERKQLVAPGEILADGKYVSGENTHREGDKLFSSKVGVVDIDGDKLDVVPLKGSYVPHVDDIVVGRISDILMSGWLVNIDAPYPALLPASETSGHSTRTPRPRIDLSKMLDVGDLVVSKVLAFDRTRDPLVSTKGPGLGKVTSGRIVKISPAKIPRLIGKKASMISILKKETGAHIMVGQNGTVLISAKQPDSENLAIEAIRMIEREAHTQGLTDRIQAMLHAKKKGEKSETARESS